MAALLAEAAETGTTVMLSSHVIADLEDACDYLVLLRDGRVRLCGEVEELLAAHRHVTGPADGAPGPAAGHVVHQSTVGRQTTALIRGTEVPPRFRADSPTLDDLVLGYLQQGTAPTSAGSAA